MDVNVSREVNNTAILSITFKLKNFTGYGLDIFVEDRNLQCERPIIDNTGFFVGDRIRLSKATTNEVRRYRISLSKRIYLEKDKSKRCVDYPNAEYESYEACEHEFIHHFYQRYESLNPFWARNTTRKISGGTFIPNITKDAVDIHANLVAGLTPSECSLPCTTHTVDSKLLSRDECRISLKIVLLKLPHLAAQTQLSLLM